MFDINSLFVGISAHFVYLRLGLNDRFVTFADMRQQSDGERRRTATFFTHFLFIVIIFVLPELVMAIAMPHRRGIFVYPGIYIKTLIYIAAFYINYYLIIDRTLVKGSTRKILYFVCWNLVIIAVGLVLSYMCTKVWFPAPWRKGNNDITDVHTLLKNTSFLMREGTMIILTIGLAVALRLSVRWKDVEQQRQELIATQRSTELDNLKSQLNPHFLFNTLNTIYALIDINSEEAKNAVHRLSGLLRYMLYENAETAQLHQETDFIKDYVDLMKLRLGKRPVEISIDIRGHESDKIAPLLFIPLVENAFKYGNTSSPSHAISIRISAEDNALTCTTENHFIHSKNSESKASSGIGLANLRRRLTLLYGTRAHLTTTIAGDVFNAKLIIPL